jgi:hypothetical protein
VEGSVPFAVLFALVFAADPSNCIIAIGAVVASSDDAVVVAVAIGVLDGNLFC